MDWFELPHESGHSGPPLYSLRLAGASGQPVPIPTLLDGPDPIGIIDIGEAGNFESRRQQLVSGVERCYGHSAGKLFCYLCLFTRFQPYSRQR